MDFKWWHNFKDLDIDSVTIKRIPLGWRVQKEEPSWLQESKRIMERGLRGDKTTRNNTT